MEAIQAATYWPAKFMGVENDWGTIVAGRHADIIAVKGGVLRYINLLQDVGRGRLAVSLLKTPWPLRCYGVSFLGLRLNP